MSDEVKRTRKPKEEDAPKLKEESKLVKMYKGEMTADVHPSMVEDYATGGWVKK